MPPRISVVVPSFNQGLYIGRTLDSILSQGIEDLEVVVMDGASTDETVQVLSEYSARDPRVRWISEPDRGQSHAVNKGITWSSGDVIGWLNSDDIYYPESLSAALTYLDEHPDVDVVYGEGDHIDEEDRFLYRHPTERWNAERLLETVFIPQPSAFFRRSVVGRCGLLDESLHYTMDYEYWLRLAQNGIRFEYIPRVLSGTRIHSSAKTIHQRLKVHAEVNDMLKARLGRVPDRWLLNYAFVAAGADTKIRASTPFRALAVLPLVAHASLKWNKSITGRALAEWATGISEKASRAWEKNRAA